MNDQTPFDVAVIGAGAVGVSCAMWARMRGLSVLLIDEGAPGSGASYGNAGTIATYACVPVNSPDIVKNLPALLFSKEIPLGLDWRYALGHMPWMLAFLRNCSAGRVRAITDHLGDLLSHTDAGLDPLIEAAGADDLMVNNGCLYVYSSQPGFEAAAESINARQRNGVEFDVLDAKAIRQLEPELGMPLHKGLLFEGARHVRDPEALIRRFHGWFVDNGGTWLQSRVKATSTGDHDVSIELAGGSSRLAHKVVVAAGAHSKSIRGAGTQHLPLDTERGHHVVYKQQNHLLSRPVGWADAGLYAIPMDGGLRIAGTVEIAGLSKPKSSDRIAYLTRKSHEMFGDLGVPDEDWLGFRPTMPDALPVIGRSTISDNIIHAFGHQHIGLTLGGITGRIVADLVEGRAPNFDISPFDPGRFS